MQTLLQLRPAALLAGQFVDAFWNQLFASLGGPGLVKGGDVCDVPPHGRRSATGSLGSMPPPFQSCVIKFNHIISILD